MDLHHDVPVYPTVGGQRSSPGRTTKLKEEAEGAEGRSRKGGNREKGGEEGGREGIEQRARREGIQRREGGRKEREGRKGGRE